MKKLALFLGILAVSMLISQNLFAQIDQLSNMSAEWIRMPTRNAAEDSTDIVLYNPAGLTGLSDGFHLNISNQTLVRQPKHSFDLGIPGSERVQESQDGIDWFLPNIYAAYKKGKWSVFGGVYVPGGGATVNYPNGSINTKFIGGLTVMLSSGAFKSFSSDYLKADSVYLTSTLGGAYKISDKLSIALGGRYINAKNTTKAGADFQDALGYSHEYKLDTKDTADGFGGIVGLDYSPSDRINIGVRYETRVSLKFETEVYENDFPSAFNLAQYKGKSRRDFPAAFGLGVSFKPASRLTVEADYTHYFQKNADWGKDSQGRDIADLAGDCWGAGMGFAYQLTPDLELSAGALYTKFNWDDMDAYYETLGAFEVLYTDNWDLGLGCSYQVMQGVKVNLGFAWTLWADESLDYNLAQENGLDRVNVETGNSTFTMALGFDLSF